MRTSRIEKRAPSYPPPLVPLATLPRSMRITRCLLPAMFLAATSGCTLWNSGVWSESELLKNSPQPAAGNTAIAHRSVSTLTHQSHDSISLSVEFRHVPSSALAETMWRSIDETAFDARTRQAWLANGLRIGLLNTTDHDATPEPEPSAVDPINELFAGAEVLGGQADGREIIPLRLSRRHELPLAPGLDGVNTVLLQRAAGLLGRDLESPQLLLAMTPENGSRSGQAVVQIRPEIQYGAMRQKFVSSDTAVRVQSGRDRWELNELNLTWNANPGKLLVIAPVMQPSESEPTFGLGRQMLRDAEHLVDDQHIVVFLQIEPR